jgi:hypothetical protein
MILRNKYIISLSPGVFGPLGQTKSNSKAPKLKDSKPFSIQGSGKEEHQRVIDFILTHLRQWED